jgi:hypothetical protein
LANEFETKFKEYLLDAPNFDLNKLQLMCKDVSNEMNIISKNILTIKNDELMKDDKNIIGLIERLQSGEESKLKLV